MQLIAKEMKNELVLHILPFWMKLVDKEYGGYFGRVDYNLIVIKESSKGVILHCRILYAFSAAFNSLKTDSYLSFAGIAYKFLVEKFLDRKFGGLYLTVDRKGNPLDARKHINVLCYALYALSEYYIATASSEVKDLAITFFQLIESKKNISGYHLEEFDQYWNKKANELLDRFGLNAEFTTNNLIHVLESYTNLYRIWPSENLLQQLSWIIHTFMTKVLNKQTDGFNEYFSSDWENLVNLTSFGHTIELSWLLVDAVNVTGLAIPKVKEIFNNILQHALEVAYHQNSFFLESLNGTPDKKRFWWVQTEAIVAFTIGYKLFGEEKYLDIVKNVWKCIKDYFIDKRTGGEWINGLSGQFQSLELDVVYQWKGPYHSTRMSLVCMKELGNK